MGRSSSVAKQKVNSGPGPEAPVRGKDLPMVARSSPLSVASMNDLFEIAVQTYSENEALKFEDTSLTYRELHLLSNKLAHSLRRQGVGPEKTVAICLERSIEMMIGIWGILKAGGAYVPIDPSYPSDRVKYMLEDSGTKIILAHDSSISKVESIVTGKDDRRIINLTRDWVGIDKESEESPMSRNDGASLAYMIYTSGSTGKPKGVMGEHRGLVNKLLWMKEHFKLSSADRFLQKAPTSFSASLREFFWPIMYGAPLVIARPGGHQDSEYLVELITSEKINVLHFVPSMLRIFLEEEKLHKCTSIKVVLCGGEALPFELQQKFFAKINAELFNAYGPTEATVAASYWRCEKNGALKFVPVGQPVADTRLYVLDENLRPVAQGVTGELFIAGSLVGRGYHNIPDLTVEKFLEDPFSTEKNRRMYRTGDQARQVSTEIIEYVGRADFQVKIRGNRIEPGEIENALIEHPNVKQAVVLPKEMKSGGGLNLIAYLAVRKTGTAASQYRRSLENRLPDYMIPALFVEIDVLPLLPNGKVDRSALMAREDKIQASHRDFVAPRNEDENKIAQVWKAVLNTDRIGVNDNYYELGGDSIQMIRILQRLRSLGIHLSVDEVRKNPTIASMSEINAKRSQGQASLAVAQLTSVSKKGKLPTSNFQKRFYESIDPKLTYSTMICSSIRKLASGIDISCLKKAIAFLVGRHDNFRTRFRYESNELFQVIVPSDQVKFDIIETDLSSFTPDRQITELKKICESLDRRVLNLEDDLLFTFQIFKLGPDQHAIYIGYHHLIGDRFTDQKFAEELSSVYWALEAGKMPDLPDQVFQFADYAKWESENIVDEKIQPQLKYWREKLGDFDENPSLPLDFERPKDGRRVYKGEAIEVPAETWLEFKKLASTERLTLTTLGLSLILLFLHKVTKGDDLVSGKIIDLRHQVAGAEGIFGLLTSLTFIRSKVTPEQTYREYIGQMNEVMQGAYANANIGGRRIRRQTLKGNFDLTFLMDVYTYDSYADQQNENKDILLEPVIDTSTGMSIGDVWIEINYDSRRAQLKMLANTLLFKKETIVNWVEQALRLIQNVLHDPDGKIGPLNG